MRPVDTIYAPASSRDKVSLSNVMVNKEAALTWKNKGNDAFKLGQFAESIECFTQAIKNDPEDHILYSNRSGSYASMGNFQKALEDANKCVRLAPNWVKGWSRKGFAEAQLGQFGDSESSYRRGLEIESSNQACKDGLRQVMDMRKSASASLDSARLQLALRLPQFKKARENEKFNEQLAELTEQGTFDASKAHPLLLEAIQLAMRYNAEELLELLKQAERDEDARKEKAKKEEAARKAAEEAAKEAAKPAELKEAEAIKERATAEYKKRNFDEALSLYAQAYNLYPRELLFLNNQAAVLIEMGRYEDALAKCDEAIAKRYEVQAPFDVMAKVFCRKGAVYTKMGDHKRAVEMYEKALLEDNNKNTRVALADAQRLMRKAEAEAYIDPALSEEHKTKGNALFAAKNFIEAKKEYDEAIKRNPNNVAAYSNRAACLMKLLEFPSALRDADECIRIDPSFVKGHLRKGLCHMHMKELNKAVAAFQKGLLVDPENAELRRNLEEAVYKIDMASRSGEVDPEMQARAMADPEIQRIMGDPSFQHILRQMQENPSAVQSFMKDPAVAANIQKLMAAGIIRVG